MTHKKQPIYQQIALDIATRIVGNDLKEGERISGRSVLSSEYNVSPETIRRAVNLLEEEGCVKVRHNSGVVVGKKEKAVAYLKSFASVADVVQLKGTLHELMEKRRLLDLEIEGVIQQIIDLSSRFSYSDPMRRFEFRLSGKSTLIGGTIGDAAFYQKTGMTIIAINRNGSMLLSPGPDAVLEQDDILIVVGDIHDVDAVKKWIEH